MQTKEERLAKLAQEIYQEEGYWLQPLYPQVFIRVLPKDQRHGLLYLPDNQQSKPMYEGIVLAVWQREGKECAVKVGQRIAFSHWAGLPTPWLDEKKYRFIPDKEIQGIIEHHHDRQLWEWLDALFKDVKSVTISGV